MSTFFGRSNASDETRRVARLGTIVEHVVKDGSSTTLTVITGPAHERRELVYSYYVQNVSGISELSVQKASNGVQITVDGDVPVRTAVADVNIRRGRLRVAVMLKSDENGPYFEVHTPKGSLTDTMRVRQDREKGRPVCPNCGREDCISAHLMDEIEEMYGRGGSRRSRSGRPSGFGSMFDLGGFVDLGSLIGPSDLSDAFQGMSDDEFYSLAQSEEAGRTLSQMIPGFTEALEAEKQRRAGGDEDHVTVASEEESHDASNGNGAAAFDDKKKSGGKKNKKNRRRSSRRKVATE